MRIAATYANGEIFQHFGHTQQFKVYEVEDGKIVASKIIGSNGAGHGALAGLLSQGGIDVLICGGIGGGAINALGQAGIEVYAGAAGSPDAAVEAMLAGALPRSAKQPVTAITPIRTAAPTTAAPAINNANPPGKCFNQLDAHVKCS